MRVISNVNKIFSPPFLEIKRAMLLEMIFALLVFTTAVVTGSIATYLQKEQAISFLMQNKHCMKQIEAVDCLDRTEKNMVEQVTIKFSSVLIIVGGILVIFASAAGLATTRVLMKYK